jgi:alkylation response protein AidB-like acyl-CoA dehydrogenase
MIDFEIPDDITALRAQVARCIDGHVLPAEAQVGTRPYFDIARNSRARPGPKGCGARSFPQNGAGMGLGHLANAIVQIEVGRSFSILAAWALNCMGPQDATTFTLIEHGTEEQKEKYLKPLVDGDIRTCFSMTEKAAGADATGMKTMAVRDGEHWVLNILGGLGHGFSMGQHRLGYGRLRHGMWSVAKAQVALDTATERAIERVTFRERVADRQGVQWMLADCAEQLYVTKLLILHIA